MIERDSLNSVRERSTSRQARRASRTKDPGSPWILSNSASLTFAGLALGVFVSRKFLMIPLAVAVTLAQEILKDRLIDRFDPRAAR